MTEEIYSSKPYTTRERTMGSGKFRIGKPVVFRDDMYSLLFISMVKPIYKKFCEENQEGDLQDRLNTFLEEEKVHENSESNTDSQSEENNDPSVPLQTLNSE